MGFTLTIFRLAAVLFLTISLTAHVRCRVAAPADDYPLFGEYFESDLDNHKGENGDKDALLCSSHSNNIYSFTLETESPIGNFDLLYIQHDGSRKIPYATTTLINSLNLISVVERQDTFRKLSCTNIVEKQTACSSTYKMTDAQATKTGRTAFDRGHLTPVDPMKFSDSAMNTTFYCVNIAPQEPYTNQQPWRLVEALTFEKLAITPGYVITGVCENDSSDGVTADGWRVPACFWKLNCFKDGGGVARVVGFIGDNSLFHKDDEATKVQRSANTKKPRSQSEILALLSSTSLVQAAWRNAETYLKANRNENNLPTATQCINALTAPTATLVDWGLV